MKIAVLSDIHGNKEALLKVLEDVKLQGAKKIFCLGDIAMGGYDPNFTISKLFELKELMGDDFQLIQGNTDKLILEYSDELFNSMYKNNPLMASALRLDNTEIQPELKEKLNIEEEKVVEVQGFVFYLVHGSTRAQDENIYPDCSETTLGEIAAKIKGDILLCGHTHIPAGFYLDSGKIIVNAGSVGRSMTEDKVPCYLLITINSKGELSFEHRKVKYDNKKVIELIKKRNFEFSNEFSKLY